MRPRHRAIGLLETHLGISFSSSYWGCRLIVCLALQSGTTQNHSHAGSQGSGQEITSFHFLRSFAGLQFVAWRQLPGCVNPEPARGNANLGRDLARSCENRQRPDRIANHGTVPSLSGKGETKKAAERAEIALIPPARKPYLWPPWLL